MIRGTTPTLEFTLPFDCSLLTEIYITFAQYGTTVLEKSMADCTCSGTLVTLSLSQEDTLKMKQDRMAIAEVQLRVRTKDGSALASNIMQIRVDIILKEGVI